MTARTRYQRISTFFGRRIPNTIYLLHLIEEYDACVSALFVALCPFFLLRGTGQVGLQATLQLAFDSREPWAAHAPGLSLSDQESPESEEHEVCTLIISSH